MGVLRDLGSTNFNLPRVRPAEQPRDAFLEAVRGVAAGEYEVFGEICRGAGGTVAYLARDLADKKLVVLRLAAGAGAGDEYSLEVVKRLDASVPAPKGACPSCGAPLRQWGRFCAMCGCDLWGDPSLSGDETKEDLLQAVKDAARGKFEVLGEIPWAEGSGQVYFVRDLQSGKLAALRLLKEGEGEYSLGRTGVLKRLAEDEKPPTPSTLQRAPKPAPGAPSLEALPLGPPSTEPAPLDSFAARSAPSGAPPTARPRQRRQPQPAARRAPARDDRWEQLLEFLRQPLVLAVIAVAALVVLVALCVAITPGSGGTARSDSPADPATPEPPQAVALASERPEELPLGYSVAIASYGTLDEALAGQRELAGLEETLYVSPTDVQGTVYYRLLCGLLPAREQAESLMARLVERGVKDAGREWDVRPSGLAFHFGTYDSRAAADQTVARLLGLGIPAYKVAASSAVDTATFHVYAGGYHSAGEARHLQERISRVGLGAELVERRGSAAR
jgi:hypothetical protein